MGKILQTSHNLSYCFKLCVLILKQNLYLKTDCYVSVFCLKYGLKQINKKLGIEFWFKMQINIQYQQKKKKYIEVFFHFKGQLQNKYFIYLLFVLKFC